MKRALACVVVFLLYTKLILATTQDDGQPQEGNWPSQNRCQTTDAFHREVTEKAAELLKRRFEEISIGEMGLGELHDITEELHTTTQPISDEAIVAGMAEKLTAKVEASTQVLNEMRRTILNTSSGEEPPVSFLYPCPLQDHHLENIEINSEKVMLNIPKSSCHACAKNIIKKYGLKVERQGYLTIADGGGVRGCREGATGGARKLLHHTMQSQIKSIIILLDCGAHMGPEGLHTTVGIAKEVVDLLGPEDVISLIHVDHQPRSVPLHDNCTHEEISPFVRMVESVREGLNKYLSTVEVSEEPSNITAGMELLQNVLTTVRDTSQVLVLYLGKQSSVLRQLPTLYTAVEELINNLQTKVIFSGCSVPDPIEYVSTLSSFTNFKFQDNSKDCTFQTFLCTDWLINLNSSQSPGEVATRLVLKLPLHPLQGDKVYVAAPHWEPRPTPSTLAPFLIPFYLPLPHKGLIFLNVYLSDLAEDIIYFNSFSTNHRAFLIDFTGNVIAHSSYPRPEFIITKPRLIDITNLESENNFQNVKSNMLQTSVGKMKINSTSYVWKWVRQMYIVCVVTNGEGDIHTDGVRMVGSVPQELQHHRMDLLPPANAPLCRHFLTVSTIHKGTLYLSPSSFLSPFSYLYDLHNGRDVSLTLVQSYMAYLKDATRLLSNPGLKSGVRDDVGILNRLLTFFKERHIKGLYNKYIVRRYAASEHGVLVLFPGTILESDFEPNRKAWFLRASRNPGTVILTPPYLDIGGAGYIVTISQVSTETSSESDTTVVVSVDITMRYLYKMLQEVFPVCENNNIRCFLMDDRGYLLSHPGLVDPSNTGPIEQTHITHKESHIVNDMLNHRDFVLKKLCKNYADSTLQRFYQFNTSLDCVLTNFVQGDHYARYHIAAVPGTNIFVGMVNSSSYAGVFCPCSVENRLCLNCNRMEQNECECPCECLLPDGECPPPPTQDVPLCEFESERNHQNNFYTRRYNLAPHLDSCFDFQCESYASKQSCLGVLGCEWCEIDRDRETPLMTPFCTTQPHCFGGVLNAPTPYEIGFFGQVTQDDLSPAYSAVGPIVGCIVALCLILALAVYCYRQNLSSTESEEPFPTPQDTWPHPPVQMSHLGSEEDILDDRSGHQDQLLLAAEPPVSPYRILTGYRRPPTAVESDHGYSTMTPHDDSEHQAFALVEPPSSPSLSTPRSSATDLPVTVLPCGKNNILAPVTVHRHMEAT